MLRLGLEENKVCLLFTGMVADEAWILVQDMAVDDA